MRIGLAYNAMRPGDPPGGERLEPEYTDRVADALRAGGHEVVQLEMTRPSDEIVDMLLDARPGLVFNLAEGVAPGRREAYYPSIYETLRIPYTGGGPALLRTGLDKRLTKKILGSRGVRTPAGAVLTPRNPQLPEGLPMPLIFKPNEEGSSMGVGRDSLANDRATAVRLASELLEEFPAGVEVEQFIAGQELTVPMLESWDGGILEIVEYDVKGDATNILGEDVKGAEDAEAVLDTYCPARLDAAQRTAVLDLARRTFDFLAPADFARIDLRLDRETGDPYFLEINPLPGLRLKSPLVTAAAAVGLSHEETIGAIVQSSMRRYGLRATA